MLRASLLPLVFVAVILAAGLSAFIIWATRPLLVRYALSKPVVRSSHRTDTPQGAGIAVISTTLLVAGGIIVIFPSAHLIFPHLIFAAILFIAIVGLADDLRSIPVVPRLILQALAVGTVLMAVSGEFRIIPAVPAWIEFVLLLFAGLWFVNLVNFMDGLDWMTVAEVIPLSAALVLLGCAGELSPTTTIAAAALGGAMTGFAPFNRPVAKVFLGDVGSLPIGLLLGWCLLELAHHQQIVAALLLPLYYLADTTVTLLRRLARREAVLTAHRSHFYQRATDNGFPVLQVVSEVFVLNLGLAALALASVMTASDTIRILLLLVGACGVAAVMWRFSKARGYPV